MPLVQTITFMLYDRIELRKPLALGMGSVKLPPVNRQKLILSEGGLPVADNVNYLVLSHDESVLIQGDALKRLLQKDDGDAALLYLAMLRYHGTVLPKDLALHWERPRLEHAEQILQELKLIALPIPDAPDMDSAPSYQQSDITVCEEKHPDFEVLLREARKKMGKPLSLPMMTTFLELYDYAGLPTDVLYLLLCHCMEKIKARYGEGRLPWPRIIRQEGYVWVRMGLNNQQAASEYLKKYADQRNAIPLYMKALNIEDRKPVYQEEEYLIKWMEMGFQPDAVAYAYEHTIMRRGKLQWGYLNSILTRWHNANWHSLEEIEEKDHLPRRISDGVAASQPDDDMRVYIQNLQRKGRQ